MQYQGVNKNSFGLPANYKAALENFENELLDKNQNIVK